MVQDVIDPVTIESSAGPVSQLIDKLGGDLAEAILRFGSGHRQVISGRNELARVCRYARRFDEALRLYA